MTSFNRIISPSGVVVAGRKLHCEEMNTRIGEMVTLAPMQPPVFGELRAWFKDGEEGIAMMVDVGAWLPQEKGKAEALHRRLTRQRRDIPQRRLPGGQ